jgi:uncharacterized protein YjiS (DUF1127 family)
MHHLLSCAATNARPVWRRQTYIHTTIPALAGANTIRTSDMFASIARLFHAWRRYDAAVRELSHLSDRELADIGISRAEIERIAFEHARS